jgi:hypothetical protein
MKRNKIKIQLNRQDAKKIKTEHDQNPFEPPRRQEKQLQKIESRVESVDPQRKGQHQKPKTTNTILSC